MRHYLLLFLLALSVPTIAQPPAAVTVPVNTNFNLYSEPDEFVSGTVQSCPGSGASRDLYRFTEYSFCRVTTGNFCNIENSVYTPGGVVETYSTSYSSLGNFKINYYKGLYDMEYINGFGCTTSFTGANQNPPAQTKLLEIIVTVENPMTFVISGSHCAGTNKPLQEFTNKPVGATLLSFRRTDTGATIDNVNDLPAGSYTIIARYDFYGNAQEISQSITISASPTVSISGESGSVCSGDLPIYLADYFTVTGGATSVTYTCVSGCEAPVVIAGTGATTNLSLSASLTSERSIVIQASATGGGSCSSSNSRTITLNESPTTPSVPAPAAICSGSTATLNFGTIPSGQVYEVWSAASGGSLIAGNITTSTWTTGALSSNITYYVGAKISASGCTSSARTSVAITIKAAAVAPTFQAVPPICSGSESRTITINNVQAGHVYNWYNGASGGTAFATGNTYTKVFNATTTYYVSADRSGCISARQPVTVNLVNVAEISAGSDLGVCGANFADIDLNITGVTLPNPAGGSWSGLSATYLTSAGILKKGSPLLSNGVYTLTYTVNQSGCNAAATRKFTVGISPTITITPDRTPKQYDLGEKVTFNHNYPTATSTEWDFGDSWKMTDLTGIHYYYSPGAKTVQVKITLNESGTVCEATGTFTNILTVKETGIITGADDPSTAVKEITTFPIPFINELNIKTELPLGNATIEMLTMDGKSYITKSKRIESGVTEIISSEEGSTIPKGMYILKVKTGTQSQTIKIVKQ
jgi:hypothetical protein